MPQCLRSRIVWLGNDPHTWIPDIQGARRDAILDTEALAIHIVQPAPPEMPPFIAGHIILVQQPMTGFKSIVASVCDSASLGMLQPQHATMCPQVLLYSTLIGLVNRDRDCQRPHVDCAAWLADEALVVNWPLPVLNGHSAIVALHTHVLPMPEGTDTSQNAILSRPSGWGCIGSKPNVHTDGDDAIFVHQKQLRPDPPQPHPRAERDLELPLLPSLTQSKSLEPRPAVVLCLDAVIPEDQPTHHGQPWLSVSIVVVWRGSMAISNQGWRPMPPPCTPWRAASPNCCILAPSRSATCAAASQWKLYPLFGWFIQWPACRMECSDH